MSLRRRQMAPSRLLLLPAELRNRVYAYFTDDIPKVQRLALQLQSSSDGGIPLQISRICPLSQVCKQLRHEYLPLWMPHLHVGMSTKNIPHFLATFCRTMYVSGSLRTLCPQRITGYIPGHNKGPNALASPSVDILPLLKCRSRAPKVTCLFEAESITDDERDVRYYQILEALMPDPTTADMSEFVLLLSCDNEEWINVVRSEYLEKVLLYPWATCDGMNVKLVFREQIEGIRLSTTSNRCYLPDLRRLGLEGVYRDTDFLSFGSKSRMQMKKTEVTLCYGGRLCMAGLKCIGIMVRIDEIGEEGDGSSGLDKYKWSVGFRTQVGYADCRGRAYWHKISSWRE